MKSPPPSAAVPAVLLSIVALAACATARTQAAAPSPSPPTASPPAARADTAPHRWTEADARFIRGMIAHHQQALEMTALVPARTTRADLRLMAQRISLSQTDEIAMMRRWLQDRGLDAPAADAHHDMPGMQHALMPGMLTPEEMARLAASAGAEFETRFLEGMIRHHEGALRMVEQLFASPGAAQESETYRFASDVDADQRAEIARMRTLLAATSPPAPRPR